MGGLRRNFPDMIRRRQAEVVNGKKVRRRNKHKDAFDPELHIKNSPKKVLNKNGKREM